MSDVVGKKRLRHVTHEDVSSDKKLKSTATPTTTDITTTESALVTQTRDATKATVNKKDSTAIIHKAAFGSPIASNERQKHSKETTPFSSKPAEMVSKQTTGDAPLSAKAESKAKTTTADENIVLALQEEPVAKIVYKVSWVWTTLLMFLWIGSSAVLGGLYLQEKLHHEMHVFQLEQEILDSVSPTAEASKKDEQDLLDLMEEYKAKAMESEAKLQGCKREFQESLKRLEQK